MKKRTKVILSLTLLIVVLFVAAFSVFSVHEHNCEHTECLMCEFIRSVNDGVFAVLMLLVIFAIVIPFVISRLDYIMIGYKSRELSLTKLMVKLND